MLEFVARAGETSRREILRAFGVKGQDRTELKRLLREMRSEGALDPDREEREADPGRLPRVGVIEITGVDADGDLLARPTGRNGGQAATIVLPASSVGRPAPGAGDRVLARLFRQADGAYEARAIKVLPRARTEVVGVLEPGPVGLYLRSMERGARGEYRVSTEDTQGAKAGELVLCDVQEAPGGGIPRARVRERLGAAEDPRGITTAAALGAGLRIAFPEPVLAEAARASSPGPEDREDLRDVDLVTIDGADARDFDDAVWASADDDPKNAGGFRILVAIADVAHHVPPGSALDEEASARGNSAYFPDRAIQMLPDPLSGNLCSLIAGEDRPCLAVWMTIDAEGRKCSHRFVRGIMRSRARLTYTQVQDAIDGRADAGTEPLAAEVLIPLAGAYAALEKARRVRGTLDLDLPEMRVYLDEHGRPENIGLRQRLTSHRIIEELMILANVAAAETLEAAGAPCMYRIHDRPDPERVEALAQFLEGMGISWRRGSAGNPKDFQRLLDQLEGHELLPLVAGFVLRAQAQAAYAPENIGHFGLNLRRYAHFTSPIRRYADLLVHRALITALGLGTDGLPRAFDHERMREIGGHISRTERRAIDAERRALDRYVTLYMSERMDAVFQGHVTGVQRFGLFVRLDDIGAEGLVPVSSLGRDYFLHDPLRHVLFGERYGEIFALGDRVSVEIGEADSLRGTLVFRINSHEPGPGARAIGRLGKRQIRRRVARSPGRRRRH